TLPPPSICEMAKDVSDGKVLLIGNIIEQDFVHGSQWGAGSGLSLVLMVFVLISMALVNLFDKKGDQSALW
ncbi:ABC transporter permease, partial [[Eubacterium] rectale]|nr:ABC transporter permease [Agathobacter rectalis]